MPTAGTRSAAATLGISTSPSPPKTTPAAPPATKHALRAFTDMQAVELAPFGVHACYVAPGSVHLGAVGRPAARAALAPAQPAPPHPTPPPP
jgi:NAD(P)-dependent dehydrogenase (short-subunit alcohol dehydrogenase family)